MGDKSPREREKKMKKSNKISKNTIVTMVTDPVKKPVVSAETVLIKKPKKY